MFCVILYCSFDEVTVEIMIKLWKNMIDWWMSDTQISLQLNAVLSKPKTIPPESELLFTFSHYFQTTVKLSGLSYCWDHFQEKGGWGLRVWVLTHSHQRLHHQGSPFLFIPSSLSEVWQSKREDGVQNNDVPQNAFRFEKRERGLLCPAALMPLLLGVLKGLFTFAERMTCVWEQCDVLMPIPARWAERILKRQKVFDAVTSKSLN